MSAFIEKFKRDIGGVFWLAVSTLLFLTFLSFSPLDPSFNSSGRGTIVSNYCGYFGSFTADLLYQVFGITAWLLVVGCIGLAIRFFRGQGLPKPLRVWVIWVSLMITTSSLIAIHGQDFRIFKNAIPASGVVGLMISKGLVAVFNRPGVIVILWSLAIMFFIYYTQKSLQEVLNKPFLFFKKLLAGTATSIKSIFAQPLMTASAAGSASTAPSLVQKILWPKEEEKPLEIQSKVATQNLQVEAEDVSNEDEDEKEPSVVSKFLLKALDKDKAPKKEKKSVTQAKAVRRVENWELPKLTMLEDPPLDRAGVDRKLIERYVRILEEKLAQFSVKGKVVAAKPGPAVTMFEFKPNSDVKISKITELADDLSLALSSESLRIIAPLPGRDVVGIETSNPTRDTVFLKEILDDPNFWDEKTKLPLVLGKQANGETRVEDLRRMPHLLVAGTTGSGKSVFVTAALTGLLFKHSPKTLRLILIDPKQVDLAAFHKIPHLLMPPIKEAKRAVTALKWAIREMDKRYRSMSKFDARGLEGFNDTVAKFKSEEIARHQQLNEDYEINSKLDTYYYQPLPYIVIIVEEFGDLMAVDKVNVEQSVVRLAQMARACGIHLVLAMQSPRKDVVTGLIKTNIPGRISFKVASKMDSRIILDESGAERLLARGDMLFLAPGVAKPLRHHAAWLTENEIASVAAFWSDQADPDFDKNAMKLLEGQLGGLDAGPSDDPDDGEDVFDERYDEILAYISSMKEISASSLQRRFKLGYPRAARLIEVFEKEGVVGPANGSKPRQVLVQKL